LDEEKEVKDGTMSYPKIFLIILNWNGKEVLKECLESIEKIDYPNYEVIVVDNGSMDGSQKMMKENFPYVHLIENEKNEGVAEGQNIGIRYALEKGTDYVFITNNDVTLDKNILKELLKGAESDDEVGIVGPIVYWADDPNRIQSGGGMINWKKGKGYHLKADEIDKGQHSVKDVDYVGSVFVSSDTLRKIGFYNSKYFAYWEDAELCTRVKKAGYKVVCVSDAKIWHKGSYTTGKISGFYEYHMARNRFWFMKQHATRRQYLSFLLYFFGFEFWFTSGIHIIYHKNINVFIAFFRGVIDGLKTIHR
jgi:GT2 family glycosyltransferase